MAYRRKKSEALTHGQWQEWIDAHREALRSIGLPPEACTSAAQWTDFVETGYIDPRVDPPGGAGFSFQELDREQMRRLLDFLRQNDEFVPPGANLPRFLEVNLAALD